jgi:hypothetical protein
VAAMGHEDEKDPKRAHVVLSQGREVVGPGYSKLSSAAATEINKGRRSDNLNRVIEIGDRDGRPGIRTRASARITLTGLPELEIGMDGQVFLTGLSGLTAGAAVAGLSRTCWLG